MIEEFHSYVILHIFFNNIIHLMGGRLYVFNICRNIEPVEPRVVLY